MATQYKQLIGISGEIRYLPIEPIVRIPTPVFRPIAPIRYIKKKKKTKKISNLGKWGNLNFIVSSNQTRTFSGMKWTSTYNYDVKDRSKKVSQVTFKGIAPDEISFSMRFSVFEGMKPFEEMEELDTVARKGKAERLLIGGKKYGKNPLVITKITRNLKYFDNKGNLWVADVQVEMKEKA